MLLIIISLVITGLLVLSLYLYGIYHIKKSDNYKKHLITKLDYLLSTHLKVDYDEFFAIVNRKFPLRSVQCTHCDGKGSYIASLNDPHDSNNIQTIICPACSGTKLMPEMIIEFSDLTIEELEKLLESYGRFQRKVVEVK